jgi:hypothetical protein
MLKSKWKLLYDWRFTANQFVLEPSLLRLNTCDHSPSVTFFLTRWLCLLWICLAFRQVYVSQIEHVTKNSSLCTSYKFSVSTGFAGQIMPIHILCYNDSLVTWTAISLTTAKFKALIFSTSDFALFSATNMFILMALYESESESYVATDGQSASLSWNRAPIWGLWPDCITIRQLRVCWCEPLSLSDKRTGLSFEIAAGPCQRSFSRGRARSVAWYSLGEDHVLIPLPKVLLSLHAGRCLAAAVVSLFVSRPLPSNGSIFHIIIRKKCFV